MEGNLTLRTQGGAKKWQSERKSHFVTFLSMKLTMICVLLAASFGFASEREDRADIERVVSALDDSRTTTAQKGPLFTTDAQKDLDRLAELDRRMISEPHAPWSEVTTPRILIQSIRFITPDVALVDATNTQYGSVILVRRVPVLIVVKKEKQEWRIAALRVLFTLGSLP